MVIGGRACIVLQQDPPHNLPAPPFVDNEEQELQNRPQ